jgi:hypothetical protein
MSRHRKRVQEQSQVRYARSYRISNGFVYGRALCFVCCLSVCLSVGSVRCTWLCSHSNLFSLGLSHERIACLQFASEPLDGCEAASAKHRKYNPATRGACSVHYYPWRIVRDFPISITDLMSFLSVRHDCKDRWGTSQAHGPGTNQ